MKRRHWNTMGELRAATIRFLHTRDPKTKPTYVDVAEAMGIGQDLASVVLDELLDEGRIVVIV